MEDVADPRRCGSRLTVNLQKNTLAVSARLALETYCQLKYAFSFSNFFSKKALDLLLIYCSSLAMIVLRWRLSVI